MSKRAKAKVPRPRARAQAKPRPRPRTKPPRPKPATVRVQTVESAVPFLEVTVRERVTEDSMMPIFEQVCAEVLSHNSRRVFVDMREAEIRLTISDMAGLAKLIGGAFAGKVERLVMLMRPEDILPEKFFEPSVTSRGVPTLATSDLGDAMHFLTANLLPVR